MGQYVGTNHQAVLRRSAVVAAPQKIDVNGTYPCPNPQCKGGQLRPITLTHALGCFQCQKIFAPTGDSLALECLSQSHLTPSSWYWQGRRWVRVCDRPPLSSVTAWVLASISMVFLSIMALVIRPAVPGFAQAALIILSGVVVFLSVQLRSRF